MIVFLGVYFSKIQFYSAFHLKEFHFDVLILREYFLSFFILIHNEQLLLLSLSMIAF